jgi:hypothetical protein
MKLMQIMRIMGHAGHRALTEQWIDNLLAVLQDLPCLYREWGQQASNMHVLPHLSYSSRIQSDMSLKCLEFLRGGFNEWVKDRLTFFLPFSIMASVIPELHLSVRPPKDLPAATVTTGHSAQAENGSVYYDRVSKAILSHPGQPGDEILAERPTTQDSIIGAQFVRRTDLRTNLNLDWLFEHTN